MGPGLGLAVGVLLLQGRGRLRQDARVRRRSNEHLLLVLGVNGGLDGRLVHVAGRSRGRRIRDGVGMARRTLRTSLVL